MKRAILLLVLSASLAYGQAGRPPVLPSTEPYASTWSTQTSVPPAKSAVYSWAHLFDTDSNGKVNVLDTTAGVVVSDANGVISNGTPGVDYTTPTSPDDFENKSISGLLNSFSHIPAPAIDGAIPLNVQTWDGTGNITVTSGKNVLELTAALGAPRTLVLPAASSLTGGIVLRFLNFSGSTTGITATNTLSFARGGSDTINGATSTITFTTNVGEIDFGSDGISKWAVNTVVSGSGTFPATITASGNQYLNGYDSTTGLWTRSQPAFTGISGTSSKAQSPATDVYTDQTNTYTAGMKQVFGASSTTAGEGFTGTASDPSSLVEGDRWYRTDLHRQRLYDGTAARSVATTVDVSPTDLTVVPTNTGGWVEYKVTSDQSTTGQTLVNVTGLVSGTLSNSTLYLFEVLLLVTTSADTTGTEYAVHGDGSGTAPTVFALITATSTSTNASSATIKQVDTATTAVMTTASSTGVIRLTGFFTSASTGTATLTIQHLKVTSGTSTVKTGSVLRVRKA